MNAWYSDLPLNGYQKATVLYIINVLLLVSCWNINCPWKVAVLDSSETRQNKIGRYESLWSFCTIMLHVYLSVPVFAGQPSLCFLPCPTLQVSFHGGLFISSFVCLFVCTFALLCSWANKAPFCPGRWYGPIKACYQPERFNDGCVVLELTGLQQDREGKRDGMLWGGDCSIPVLWLSGSTADSRQGKISLLLLLSGGRERPASCRSCLKTIVTVQSYDLCLWVSSLYCCF